MISGLMTDAGKIVVAPRFWSPKQLIKVPARNHLCAAVDNLVAELYDTNDFGFIAGGLPAWWSSHHVTLGSKQVHSLMFDLDPLIIYA